MGQPVSTSQVNPIPVPAVSGTLQFQATGGAISFSSLFEISLYGPESKDTFVGSAAFSGGKDIIFQNLKPGTYWWTVQRLSINKILVRPRKGKVLMESGQLKAIDIILN